MYHFNEGKGLGASQGLNHGEVTRKDTGRLMEDKIFLRFVYESLTQCRLPTLPFPLEEKVPPKREIYSLL